MKTEVRQLKEKATNALILSIEHFNRPSDLGRTEAVLILFDHAFEMLLKAAILHRGGKIRKVGDRNTIGFRACINKGRDESGIRFLNYDQSVSLNNINQQRNAVQHYLNDISEHHLYVLAQTGVTLFRDIHDKVFDGKLTVELPGRVLPISTTAPTDLVALFEREIKEVRSLLQPGKRKKKHAINKIRSWALLENAVKNQDEPPSERELESACRRLSDGEEGPEVFPGVASINYTSDKSGSNLYVRLNKNEGTPVRFAKNEEELEKAAIVREVNSQDHYSLTPANLAEKVNLTQPKCLAVVRFLRLRDDPIYYKEFKFGKTIHGQYAPIAINKIKETLEKESLEKIWEAHRPRKKSK